MTANVSCLKCLFRQTRMLKFYNHVRGVASQDCSTIEKRDDKIEEKSVGDNPDIDDLVEPTTCCMSGCANCVWIQYAERLSKSLENCNEDVQKMIMDKVQDPNMRAFLTMELRFRKIIH